MSSKVWEGSEGLKDSRMVRDSSTARVIRRSWYAGLRVGGGEDALSWHEDESCSCIELVLDGLRDVGQLLATWASEASQAPLPLDTAAIIEARLTGGGGGTETDAEVGIGRVLNVERRMEETEGG